MTVPPATQLYMVEKETNKGYIKFYLEQTEEKPNIHIYIHHYPFTPLLFHSLTFDLNRPCGFSTGVIFFFPFFSLQTISHQLCLKSHLFFALQICLWRPNQEEVMS